MVKKRLWPSGAKADSPSSFWNVSEGRSMSCCPVAPSPPRLWYSQISPVPREREVVKCLRAAM